MRAVESVSVFVVQQRVFFRAGGVRRGSMRKSRREVQQFSGWMYEVVHYVLYTLTVGVRILEYYY